MHLDWGSRRSGKLERGYGSWWGGRLDARVSMIEHRFMKWEKGTMALRGHIEQEGG